MSVAVVGFGIGYQNCFISVARGGGIETIDNEYSDRCTQTFVSFGPNSRAIGAAAKQQQVTNVKNSIYGFTKLIGKQFSDPLVQEEMKHLPYDVVQLPNNYIGIKVSYLGETQIFTPEQLVAMQLSKLRHVAETHLQAKVVDIVLNVPTSATDFERRALIDATQIAGLNCIRLINDTTAIGVTYGLFNKDLPPQDQPPRVVAFVDMGHSNFQVALVAYNDGKMKVLGCACDQYLGGRDFDRLLFNHIAAEFKKIYGLNVNESPKASIRLLQECEKLKKLMSANSTEIPLNIECFMNDVDVSFRMKRADFEVLCEKIFLRIKDLLTLALTNAGLTSSEEIQFVEVVGGSTRVPAVKAIIQQVFGKEPRSTLNADEAVARGCSLQCAILSPAFRVRDFAISDISPYGISITYEELDKGIKTMEVFPKGYLCPSSRQITFLRKEPFQLHAHYSNPELVPSALKSIGNFIVQNVQPNPETGEGSKIKVKVRLNTHGIFNVSVAQLVERMEKPVTEDAAEKSPTHPETDANLMETGTDKAAEAAPAAPENGADKKPKTKIVQKLTDLPIQATLNFTIDRNTISEFTEKESKMIMQDKLEKERMAAKNAVEEYVYEMRDKLSGPYEPLATDDERDTLNSELSRTEDWLYDEGEDLHKQAYVDKLNLLRNLSEKLRIRAYEAEMRPQAIDAFGHLCVGIMKAIESYKAGEEQYNHIAAADITKLENLLEEKQKWFSHELQQQSSRKPHEDPLLTVERIHAQHQVLESTAKAILNKPKPKVEPPPAENKKNGPDTFCDSSNNQETPVGDEANKKNLTPAEDMDID